MGIESQNKRILAYMKNGNSITQLEAVEKFGCFRLSARISDIKQMGYEIRKEMIAIGDHYFAKYSLVA